MFKKRKDHPNFGFKVGTMTDDDWPIGQLLDGSLNAVTPDDAKFRPRIVADLTLVQELAALVASPEQPKGHVDLESFWAELNIEVRKLRAEANIGGLTDESLRKRGEAVSLAWDKRS